MKKFLIFLFIYSSVATAISSCGPKCKKCHMELLGVKTPEQEVCGDQLKQVEKTAGMVCQ